MKLSISHHLNTLHTYTHTLYTHTPHIQSMCAQYWPDKVGGSVIYGKVSVKLISESTDQDIIVRKLEVSSTVKAVRYVMAFDLFSGVALDEAIHVF